MNVTDLQRLAGHLRNHALQVVPLEPETRLHATNPLRSLLTEESVAEGGRYVTSFSYEIGEPGRERACADRFSHRFAARRSTMAEAS